MDSTTLVLLPWIKKMIKYFYLVIFEYYNCKYKSNEQFDLGVFSTKKNAELKIRKSTNLDGFKDHSSGSYNIIKFGVNFDSNNTIKSNAILYCVSHEYYNDSEDVYYWNLFEYYSLFSKAKERVKYLKKHSHIGKKYPNNFEISKVKVDNYNNWSEGFN